MCTSLVRRDLTYRSPVQKYSKCTSPLHTGLMCKSPGHKTLYLTYLARESEPVTSCAIWSYI